MEDPVYIPECRTMWVIPVILLNVEKRSQDALKALQFVSEMYPLQ